MLEMFTTQICGLATSVVKREVTRTKCMSIGHPIETSCQMVNSTSCRSSIDGPWRVKLPWFCFCWPYPIDYFVSFEPGLAGCLEIFDWRFAVSFFAAWQQQVKGREVKPKWDHSACLFHQQGVF